jgi:hypothetical protein
MVMFLAGILARDLDEVPPSDALPITIAQLGQGKAAVEPKFEAELHRRCTQAPRPICLNASRLVCVDRPPGAEVTMPALDSLAALSNPVFLARPAFEASQDGAAVIALSVMRLVGAVALGAQPAGSIPSCRAAYRGSWSQLRQGPLHADFTSWRLQASVELFAAGASLARTAAPIGGW